MLAIVRKTLGWQKACDTISVRQMRDATGLSLQGTMNGIEAALKRGILKRSPSGFNKGYCYEIDHDQVFHELEHLKCSTKLSSQRSRTQVFHEVEHKVVNEVEQQKKDIKKEKERDSGRAKRAPRTPTEKTPEPVILALADMCKIDQRLGTKEQKLQLYSTAKDLYQAGAAAGKTPDEIADTIRYVGKHWQSTHWKGKKGDTPWPKDIREDWRAAIEARSRSSVSSTPVASKPNIAPDALSREELAEAARNYRNGTSSRTPTE
jgi:hypothetical protein